LSKEELRGFGRATELLFALLDWLL
jgi:hypothetical protein